MRHSWWKFALVGLLALIDTALVMHGPKAPASAWAPPTGYQEISAAEPAEDPSAAPEAVFVGDSYTAKGAPWKMYWEIACGELGWSCTADAAGSTGFIAEGLLSEPEPYITRLESRSQTTSPDYVVVTGGRNDISYTDRAVRDATDEYFTALRIAYPKAEIITLSPFWHNHNPTSELLMVERNEKRAADAAGCKWISTHNWLGASDLQADHVHPDQGGQQVLAGHLAPALRRVTAAAQ